MIAISFFQIYGRLAQRYTRHTDTCRFYGDGIVEVHGAVESINEVATFEVDFTRRCSLDSLDGCIVAGGTGHGGIRIVLGIPLISNTC